MLGLRLALVLFGPPIAEAPSGGDEPVDIHAAPQPDRGHLSGEVRDWLTDELVAGASVTLLCSCLADPLRMSTDERGHYEYDGLPEGSYTISVEVGTRFYAKMFELPRDARFRANFSVDPWVPSGKPKRLQSQAERERIALLRENRRDLVRAIRKYRRAERARACRARRAR